MRRFTFGKIARDQRGVSAVEFALVAPVMITLYFGCVAISDAVAVNRKVTLVAAAMANLASQVSTITTGQMTDLLDASSAIMAPYPTGPLKLTIKCLSIDATKKVTEMWTQDGVNGGAGVTPVVPDALTVSSTYPMQLIYSQVSYAYTPIVGNSFTGAMTLSDKMYMAPRQGPPNYNNKPCVPP